MRRKVDSVGLEVIIDENDAIILDILLNTISLHDAHQLRWRQVLPASHQAHKDVQGQGEEGRVRAIWFVA
jgi:hypothetical protein